MMVHCLVGVGFLTGSLIVRPFLPTKSDDDSKDFQKVCSVSNVNNSEDGANNLEDVVDVVWGLPSIYWPYIIMAAVVVLSSWCFLPLALVSKYTVGQKKFFFS